MAPGSKAVVPTAKVPVAPAPKPVSPEACLHCKTDKSMVSYGPAMMWRVCHGCGCHFLWNIDTLTLTLRTPNPDCEVYKATASSAQEGVVATS